VPPFEVHLPGDDSDMRISVYRDQRLVFGKLEFPHFEEQGIDLDEKALRTEVRRSTSRHITGCTAVRSFSSLEECSRRAIRPKQAR
jgi:hypothetical protein